MRVYTDGQFDKDGGCVLALGSFDALHIAHMELIEKTLHQAKRYGVRAGVHLFFERIENVLHPEGVHKSIYTNEQRVHIIEEAGADFAYFESFDTEFMHMSAYDFAKMLKSKFGAVCVVVGFHYTFGYMGEGNVDILAKYGRELGFDVVVMPAVTLDGKVVSSTKIRTLIKDGEISEVRRCLGRSYELCGSVIRDRGVGRQMGLPTANIRVSDSVLLPKNGVYAAYVTIGGKEHVCVVNVGIRPTFELESISVEVHVIDFAGDLYGEKMCVCFLERLRNEKKFDTKEELSGQIFSDIDNAKVLFSKKR